MAAFSVDTRRYDALVALNTRSLRSTFNDVLHGKSLLFFFYPLIVTPYLWLGPYGAGSPIRYFP